jgi:hypothetical protein
MSKRLIIVINILTHITCIISLFPDVALWSCAILARNPKDLASNISLEKVYSQRYSFSSSVSQENAGIVPSNNK